MYSITLIYVIFQILFLDSVLSSFAFKLKETDPETYQLFKSSRIGDEDANLDVPQIIAKYGYSVEIHEVTTEDGYILTLHRIPTGKNSKSEQTQQNKPTVMLQHGLLGDSSNWIMNNEGKALAYELADAGYDVWMCNSRGNKYSKKHQTLPTTDEKYWDFSFHEMGIYDLPASIDYVLRISQQSDLFYYGYSQGTTIFFVCMTERPEYNAKIKLMSAFAPLAYTEHVLSPLNAIASMSNKNDEILALLGAHEFLPSVQVKELFGAAICRAESLLPQLCSNVLFLIGGYNSTQFDQKLITVINGHTPGGTSVRNIVHYAQGINSTVFGQFNYGTAKNLEIYGQETPPKYNLSKINCPVAIYWAENDLLSSSVDTYRLTEELYASLVMKYRINNNDYNHLDYIWGIDNDKLLVKQSLDFMKYFLTAFHN